MYHVFAVSLLLRLALILNHSTEWLSDRVELSTPLNSWTRRNNIYITTANYYNYSERRRGFKRGGDTSLRWRFISRSN